ncbi:MAG: SecY-interacting protein [Pseudomonadales bacterium]|nr:SecY-interacting protein [Pseudomonadales bacterium]MDP7595370.1 SecY-interacting protein [Pseudomonadales bacterium]HJN51933.1 SecY-interacting protein [Pseudomonadales bacterium]
MSNVETALADFMQRFKSAAAGSGGAFPPQKFDPDWPSPCRIGAPAAGYIRWEPVPQSQTTDFRGLENALELEIHKDIKAYYGSYWCGALEATAEEGHVSLIQMWNPQDFDRLIENLIGHAMAKRRLKHPFTVFVATTEADSELFLSVDNDTGGVLLEEPGCPPRRQVDENLASFIDRLTPCLAQPKIY